MTSAPPPSRRQTYPLRCRRSGCHCRRGRLSVSLPPLPLRKVVAAAAQDRVVEVRCKDIVDAAGDGVMANRAIAIRGAGCEIDRHAGRRVTIQKLRATVAGDCVVAAVTLELIESDKAERIVAIGQIAADRAVTPVKVSVPNRPIAGRRATAAGTDRDRHARSGIAILDLRGAVAGDAVVAAIAWNALKKRH